MPDGSSSAIPAAVPPVKCLGGKRKLAPTIIGHMPDVITRYVEPFAGGAAVFFALYALGRLKNADVVLADTNDELIALYLAIRDESANLLAHLREHEGRYRRQRDEYFYAVRSQDHSQWNDNARIGARYVFLNKTCFNGVSRYNSLGKFNVPHGRFKSEPVICDAANIMMCAHAFADVDIRLADFKDVLAREQSVDPKPGRVVYLDPPYVPLSKTSNFTSYGKDGFRDDQQIALAEAARDLAKAGARVIASNSAASRVRELYGAPFTIHEIGARRSINSDTKKRGEIKELIMVSA
jgi:DNA adenine methylase